MAVNKITNKGVVNKELVNRANEVSTKGTTIRGNRETTIIPGNNFSDNYSITLKDVDTAVLNHVKNVMKPRVREANETLKNLQDSGKFKGPIVTEILPTETFYEAEEYHQKYLEKKGVNVCH